jgi:protein involved in polysaccharide export with SLBB domain
VTRSTVARIALAAALAAGCGACATTDDARAQQLLTQRGFGSRYVGDSNEQYYLGIGDSILVTDSGHPEFNEGYVIRSDGVISVQNIGEVFVAGLTIPDCQEMLKARFREYNTTADPQVELRIPRSKAYFVDGMIGTFGFVQPRAQRVPFNGDVTIYSALVQAPPSPLLAASDRIKLIRADPYHPLVVEFDYEAMREGGWSKYNVEVRENDIIYIPPNIFGHITIFTQKLFSPLTALVTSLFGLDRLYFFSETFANGNRFNSGYNRYGGLGWAPAPAGSFQMQVAPLDPDLAIPGGG